MCCSSGVCGPQVDPLLAAFAADVDWLGRQGVTVTRHNQAQEPRAFVSNPVVQQTLLREGDACRPLVLINGEIAARGAYPRRDELARLAGLVATASSMKPKLLPRLRDPEFTKVLLITLPEATPVHEAAQLPRGRTQPALAPVAR